MTSHGTNYSPKEDLEFGQHDPYAISSEMMLWYSYPVSSISKLKSWLGYCINELI